MLLGQLPFPSNPNNFIAYHPSSGSSTGQFFTTHFPILSQIWRKIRVVQVLWHCSETGVWNNTPPAAGHKAQLLQGRSLFFRATLPKHQMKLCHGQVLAAPSAPASGSAANSRLCPVCSLSAKHRMGIHRPFPPTSNSPWLCRTPLSLKHRERS